MTVSLGNSPRTWKISYSATRPYPWPRFTPIVLVVSILFLSVLTLINVAAVGYRSVVTISDSPYQTQSYWWSAFDRHQYGCEPHEFHVGDVFQTVNSAFKWTVYSLGTTVKPTYPKISGTEYDDSLSARPYVAPGWAYSGESLSLLCTYSEGPGAAFTQYVSLAVDSAKKSVEGSATYFCGSMDNENQGLIQMKYTSGPSQYMVSPLQSQYISTWTALQNALDLLATDVLIGVGNATSIIGLSTAGSVYCPINTTNVNESTSNEQYPICMAGTVPVVSVDGVYASYTNNSLLDIQGNTYPALNQSISNYLQAISAAAQADLGIWFGNSLFANAKMINVTLSSADAVTAALQASPELQTYYAGYQPTNISGAQILRMENYTGDEAWAIGIPIPEAKQAESAPYISTTYLCQVPKLKGALDFIISVLAADAAIFLAFWAIFTFAASRLAERSPKTTINSRNSRSPSYVHSYGRDEETGLSDLPTSR